MITIDQPIRRSQLYSFLANGFLYPTENWLEDLPGLAPLLDELGLNDDSIPTWRLDLTQLQAAHRHALGLTGSLCYETEYGLPNEFRQSHELADIAGFYRAFGFEVGGQQRERPDHLAMELEFMYVMTLKEASACHQGLTEHIGVCRQAQCWFIQDHLGRWVGLVAASLEMTAGASVEYEQPYLWLARLAERFVRSEAERLGVELEYRSLADVRHTPVVIDTSCGDCPVA